jgi:hypothetical protein
VAEVVPAACSRTEDAVDEVAEDLGREREENELGRERPELEIFFFGQLSIPNDGQPPVICFFIQHTYVPLERKIIIKYKS